MNWPHPGKQSILGVALALSVLIPIVNSPDAAAWSPRPHQSQPPLERASSIGRWRHATFAASTLKSSNRWTLGGRPSSQPPRNPFHPRDLAQYLAAKRGVVASRPRSGLIAQITPQARRASAALKPGLLTASPVAFTGMSNTRQVNALGRDHDITPPDTQLGAGPSQLVEMVNDTASVWSKTGTLLSGIADLNVFFDVPNGYFFTDPRVFYDPISSRWFASGLAFDAFNDSNVFVGVSDTSDALDTWSTWSLGPFASTLADQPKLGVSNDKAVISWNDFAANGTFTGEETWVIQESDLLAGVGSPAVVSFGPDNTRISLVPAVAQTSTNTEWVLYGASSHTASPVVGIVAIDGTPAMSNVTWTESDPSTPATAFPPLAPQAWGRPVDTGDDRLLSAVFQSGVIWASGDDRCMPNNDTKARACLRFVQVQAGSPPSLLQDFDVGIRGDYIDYPAVALDGGGNVDFSFSRFAATKYPSVWTGQISGPSVFIALMRRGQGPYSGWDPAFGANRWGDYSGAAVDPANPNVVWLAGEFAATSARLRNWGTEIGKLWSSAPPDTVRPRLTKVRDAPDPFTPNGDGIRDKVKIYWRVSEGAAVTDKISRKGGGVVATFLGYVTKGAWIDTWNGRSDRGRRVPAGIYVYRIVAVDGAGNHSLIAHGTVADAR